MHQLTGLFIGVCCTYCFIFISGLKLGHPRHSSCNALEDSSMHVCSILATDKHGGLFCCMEKGVSVEHQV